MVKLLAVLWLLAAATASTEAWKCWENNTAYFGNNIPESMSYQLSTSACQQSCAEHSGCSYWTWGRRAGECYLKTSDDGRMSMSPMTDDYVSGTKDCNVPEEKLKG